MLIFVASGQLSLDSNISMEYDLPERLEIQLVDSFAEAFVQLACNYPEMSLTDLSVAQPAQKRTKNIRT